MNQTSSKVRLRARYPCLAGPRLPSQISVLVERAADISETDTGGVDESKVRLGVGQYNGENCASHEDQNDMQSGLRRTVRQFRLSRVVPKVRHKKKRPCFVTWRRITSDIGASLFGTWQTGLSP